MNMSESGGFSGSSSVPIAAAVEAGLVSEFTESVASGGSGGSDKPDNPALVWWMETSDADAIAALGKSTEYGGRGTAIDLVWLGQQIADLIDPARGARLTDAEASELGIFVYLLGKVARWKAAVLEERPVSADTLKDLTTYAMMARHVREHGTWP